MEEGGASRFIEWEVVFRSINLGSLGIGNLRIHNKTLLAKWLWTVVLLLEPYALWHRVIVSKYNLRCF